MMESLDASETSCILFPFLLLIIFLGRFHGAKSKDIKSSDDYLTDYQIVWMKFCLIVLKVHET